MESKRPLISVIVPAYNEESLLQEHVGYISDHLRSLEIRYDSEILIINDGSSDATGSIANELASANPSVRAIHHPRNFGLGQALKFGFANSRGDYVVVLDVDLSYDVQHIGELVDKMRKTHSKIVIASPYMQGGSIKNVPWLRRFLSVAGNRFLKTFVRGHVSTLTGMVRVYDGPFIRSLDLRSTGMDIMPEAIYKALVLRATIEEVPGRLDWGPQMKYGASRTSSLKLLGHVMSTVLSGFLFRPFLFFIVPGLLVGLFAAYVDYWMFVHFFEAYAELSSGGGEFDASDAFALAYAQFPHTFVTALLSSMLAIQLIGLGIVTLQNKRYFEDLFHQGASGLRELRRPVD
jgi:glycosyltransferase involved in cell wall biosynthesis